MTPTNKSISINHNAQNYLNKKKVIFSCGALLLIASIVVCFVIKNSSYNRAFQEAICYWLETADEEVVIDPSIVAGCTIPFMSKDGLEFLLEKMEEGTRLESKTAILQLVCLWDLLSQSDSVGANDLSKMINHEVLEQRVKEYSRECDDNPTVCNVLLSYLLNRSVGDRCDTQIHYISGTEWWRIKTKKIKVIGTSVYINGTNDFVLNVVIDRKNLSSLLAEKDLRCIAMYAKEHGYVEKAIKYFKKTSLSVDTYNIQVFLGDKTDYGVGAIAVPDGLIVIDR